MQFIKICGIFLALRWHDGKITHYYIVKQGWKTSQCRDHQQYMTGMVNFEMYADNCCTFPVHECQHHMIQENPTDLFLGLKDPTLVIFSCLSIYGEWHC